MGFRTVTPTVARRWSGLVLAIACGPCLPIRWRNILRVRRARSSCKSGFQCDAIKFAQNCSSNFPISAPVRQSNSTSVKRPNRRKVAKRGTAEDVVPRVSSHGLVASFSVLSSSEPTSSAAPSNCQFRLFQSGQHRDRDIPLHRNLA